MELVAVDTRKDEKSARLAEQAAIAVWMLTMVMGILPFFDFVTQEYKYALWASVMPVASIAFLLKYMEVIYLKSITFKLKRALNG